MKRFLALLSLAAIPSVALAAALSAPAEVIGSLLSETRPMFFSVAASHHGGAVTAVKVQGQKEGAGPEKAWVSIKTQWKGSSQWMNTEADVNLKGGKAYFRLASVTGSAGAPDLAAFQSMKGRWYTLDASDAAVRSWFVPSLSVNDLGSRVALSSERFQTGFSYSFWPTGSAESVRSAVASGIPWLIAPESSASFKAKIDTNLSNEFQFGSMSFGSTFEAKAQRQFHAVYVETPTSSMTLPDGAVKDFFFQGSAPAMVEPMSEPAAPSSAASSSVRPGTVSGPSMRMTNTRNPSDARRARRLAQRAIVDLHGPSGKDLKVSALIATGPIEWESPAAFNADFGEGRGILYRYDKPVSVRFSTQGAYEGLEVIFFDAAGRYISSATMPRCTTGECPTFMPDRPASFALEVGVGFIDRTKIGALWRLSLDWAAAPVPGSTTRQMDRTAVRIIENRLQIPAPVGWHAIESTGGDQSLRVLAETTVKKLRIADIASASAVRRDEDAAHRLYAVLVDTLHMNKLKYAFIVVPGSAPDTYTLVLDSYTYAPVDVLDFNRNGKIDSDEKPAEPGSSYVYHTFTAALEVPVFDQSSAGELGVYVPVKDDNGTTVALLALVEDMQK